MSWEDGVGVGLTDGGIETYLLFRDGFDLPCFAAFPLLDDEDGRAALRRYFARFLELAERRGLPFVLDTVTWRANPDWTARLGYDTAAANGAAVAFARELADGRGAVTINGVVGPRGDGYVVSERMTAATAADYHGPQIGVLRAAGVAEFFLVNCAHPTHIAAGLDGAPQLERIGGLRVNGSALSHAELDEAETLADSDPVALARDHAALRDALPAVRLLGGCCGTDHRHVAEIVAAWEDRANQ